MLQNIISFLIKLGLVAESMIKPRELTGPARMVVAVIAVCFSYFFIHISFFGPPISEYFKGTYILCTAALCVMVYKGRQTSIRENFSWLDEIFLFLTHMLMCAVYLLWAYWTLAGRTYLWNDFTGGAAAVAALLGAILGAVLYWREATMEEIPEKPLISDWLYLGAGIAPIVWWVISNVELVERVGGPVPTSVVIFSGLLAAVSFEIARRVVGPVIPLIGFFFLIYTFKPIAQLPSTASIFYHDGFGLGRVAEFLMLEADGMTGLIVEVFATYIVIFVVLGAFLEKTGLGAILIDTTFRLTGHKTGGPGLTAVISSGLFGMISGSGVANVVTTGTFTSPLMKRVGYRSEFAGAVEAAASTGGAYMPPIMAGGAFLIAQLTETSYFHIIKVAALPAILYYLSVGYMVYLRAVRRGLLGVPTDELPPWPKILPRIHFLLPIPFMIYYLMIGDSAFLAAFKTICLIIMLKSADMLNEIRTPWSDRTWRPFLGLSLLFGVFAYYLGLRVGAPFSWFADTLRGLNMGDGLFWVVALYLFLKIGEILAAGFTVPEISPRPANPGENEDIAPATGSELFTRLGKTFTELVKVIWISLEAGAKNTLVVGCIAGVLGILLSCATQSDLSGRISIVLTEFSFGLLPLTIFWVIVAGYVVGMGLPITASYVVLVIFGVIALTNLGVPTLTAHLICFWVAVVSAVTPPVALAAYAASAIATSDPLKTGFQALKLASWLFVMPFLFVYTPILLTGTSTEVTITFIACLFGIVGWAGWLEGFLIKTTMGPERALLFLSSICLLLPVERFFLFTFSMEGDYHYPTYVLGVLLLGASFLIQRGRTEATPRAA